MRLTRFTDVALRVLMRLAVAEGGEAPTTREVAASMRVPYTHAAKVVARLQHLGLLDARRGRGGGLTLTSIAHSASIGSLVRELEGPEEEVVECEGDTPCPLRSGCCGALRRAQDAFYATLEPITVADLVTSPTGPLLLGIGSGPPPDRSTPPDRPS